MSGKPVEEYYVISYSKKTGKMVRVGGKHYICGIYESQDEANRICEEKNKTETHSQVIYKVTPTLFVPFFTFEIPGDPPKDA